MSKELNGCIKTNLDFVDYKTALDEETGNDFMKLKQSYVKYLHGNGSAAIVLAYTMNYLWKLYYNSEALAELEKNNAWFECPAKMIQKELGMGEVKVRKAIQFLRQLNLIEMEHRAGNGIWMHVALEKIQAISETRKCRFRNEEMSFQKRGNVVSHIDIKNIDNKNCCSLPLGNRGSLSTSGQVSPQKALAFQLHNLLVKHNKLTRKANLANWIKEFATLLQTRTAEEVKEKLVWYDQHIGEEYVPCFYSAKSFCDGYPRLEDAVRRWYGQQKKKEVKEKVWDV